VPTYRLARRSPLIALTLAFCACNSDPRGASREYLRNENEYLAKGKYKEASLLYRRALQKHAKYAESGFQLGLVNDRLENLAEARKTSRARWTWIRQTRRPSSGSVIWICCSPQPIKAATRNGSPISKSSPRHCSAATRNPTTGFRRDRPHREGSSRAIGSFENANLAKPYQKDLVLALVQSLEIAG